MSNHDASKQALVVDDNPLMRMAGFDDFIFKPVDGAQLDELLEEVMVHA